MKRILAILQNQWFKDPAAVEAIFRRWPDRRNDLIARYLFMGCLTGRRLEAAFGTDVCNRIVWEEASPKIAGQSSGVFSADLEHLTAALAKHQPEVVLCFGKVASDAIRQLNPPIIVLTGPHPTARPPVNPVAELRRMAAELTAIDGA